MKKWLVKLEEHIDVVQIVVDGYYDIVDQEGNKLVYSIEPDYILEKDLSQEYGSCVYYFYPKNFYNFKEQYYVVYNICDLQEMLKTLRKDFKINILNYEELNDKV
jgi:hypothetical protein